MELRAYIPYLASLAVSSFLVATGIYQYSYDATTHIFFASHYVADWFSTWDARWYGGMSVTGYPPLVHQLMALVSFASGIVVSFGVVAAGGALFVIWGTKRFAASLDMDSEALTWLVALSPGVYLFLFGFGQLPELISTAFILSGGAYLNRYVASGGRRDLLLASLLSALSLFCNLEAPLIGLPAIGVVALSRVGKPSGLARLAAWVGATSAVVSPILYQVLLFIRSTPAQAPIPQETRLNILASGNVVVLFLGIYGPVLFLLPLGVYAALRRRKRVLLALTLFLMVMGLGGTTPVPELVLGPGLYNLLTYEKFSLVAMFFLSVPVGAYLDGFWRRKGALVKASKVALVVVLVLSTAGTLVNTYQVDLPTASPNLQAVSAYLNSQPGTGYWVTLGVGPIGRELSLNTTHPTLDGGFNTARRLPVEYQSGVDSIDNAKFFPNGPNFVNEILGGNYGVRWAIVGDPFYFPYLQLQGYHDVLNVSGALPVTIWEKGGYQAGFAATYTVRDDVSYVWGAYPLVVLAATVLAGLLSSRRARRRPGEEEPQGPSGAPGGSPPANVHNDEARQTAPLVQVPSAAGGPRAR
ncbi:MAG: hypothetical protein JRM74_04890 [Nitrososphaerota archaeon]|nr:hypothetical protein [Nitrososphaerota archaeon]